MSDTEIAEKAQTTPDIEQLARQRAKHRSFEARWNLDIAVFAFAVLVLVVILGFQKVRIEIVAPIAVVGLGIVWLCGWWQGKKLYKHFYAEELFMLKRDLKKSDEKPDESDLEEMVMKAIRERYK